MKKYGFTLIETVISIFILSILFSVGLSLSKLRSGLSRDMENTAYVYEIQNLLSYGKAVCIEKNMSGKIIVDSNENKIYFIDVWKNVESKKTVDLPKEIRILSKIESMKIDSDGKITQGNTITLLDNYGERQDITIGVGVDLIVIKDGDFL